jgi:Cd2+/Zn2+-exporting ATPase
MKPQISTFHIVGICCAEEELVLRKKLESSETIRDIKYNLVTQKLTVAHSCPVNDVVARIRGVGFNAYPESERNEMPTLWEKYSNLTFTLLGGLFLLAGIFFQYIGTSETISVVLFILSAVNGGWRVAVKGLKEGKNLSLGMNFLMTIATIGAMAIGKWEEAAAVMFLFSLAQLLEFYSMDRTRKAIRSLMAVSPAEATIKRGGSEVVVNVRDIRIGERVFIHPGERIPLDGVVVAGNSTVNQAPITGESFPVSKQTNDQVFAGTINERGILEIRVTKPHYDTTLAHIIRLVEEAQSERAPSQHFVERFARYYTPIVIGLAISVAIIPPFLLHAAFQEWFYRALVLLVIACPCALVISTPVAIVSGLTNAARRGILIKGGRQLELLGSIRAIAFDKTGTLTEGMPKVTDVIPLNSLSKKEILSIAAAIESRSEHPIAAAVLDKAAEKDAQFENVSFQHFEALAGRGITATIRGTAYFVGNHQLFEEKGICSPKVEEILNLLESEGKTTIIVGTDNEAVGVIGITDTVREESRRTIQQLHRDGVGKVIMLTGDNPTTAKLIADQIGIEEYQSLLLPEEKVKFVKRLKDEYEIVAMVGDGVNDAPALAASTVGIAMGTTGTDAAFETADIVLMSDDLSNIPYTVALSKNVVAIIKQNIVFALITKIIFLVLGMFGMATLWMALLADDGATLIVILNGLRALKFKRGAA